MNERCYKGVGMKKYIGLHTYSISPGLKIPVIAWRGLSIFVPAIVSGTLCYHKEDAVSRQLVYGHFVYDTSSTDISSTDISSTMTFLAEIETGVMKRIPYQ